MGREIWLGYKIGEGRYKGAGTALPRSLQSPPAPSSPANPAFTAILARRQPSTITGLPPALTPRKKKKRLEKDNGCISSHGALARGPAVGLRVQGGETANGRRSTNLFHLLQRLLVDTALLEVILRRLHHAIDDLCIGGALFILLRQRNGPDRVTRCGWGRGCLSLLTVTELDMVTAGRRAGQARNGERR